MELLPPATQLELRRLVLGLVPFRFDLGLYCVSGTHPPITSRFYSRGRVSHIRPTRGYPRAEAPADRTRGPPEFELPTLPGYIPWYLQLATLYLSVYAQ